MWLHADDYPSVVAAADLGVCMHQSSSGFDLPMKVVDMFSAGLPCLAIGGYASLNELVVDGVNGKVFYTSKQLAEQILTEEAEIIQFRENLKVFKQRTWSKQWTDVMLGAVLL